MPPDRDPIDLAVRYAAFQFLEMELERAGEETLSFDVLREGFDFRGTRVRRAG